MKKILELLNTLDKVETITLNQKIIKKIGMDAMMSEINNLYPDFKIIYHPGNEFKAEEKGNDFW